MSVLNPNNKMPPYACDGGTVNFDFTFPILAPEDLQVWLIQVGTATLLTLTTHYSVAATNNDYANGGTVTTVATYGAGYSIIIVRVLAATQPVDYQAHDDFPAETHERALDRLTMLVQQLIENVARCVSVPVTDDAVSLEVPGVADRASGFAAFNAEGEAIAASGVPNVPATAFTRTLLDDEDAAEARATLDVVGGDDLDDLAGVGRTDETVKQNADDVATNAGNISDNADAIDDLAGAGRTDETVKQNADDIAAMGEIPGVIKPYGGTVAPAGYLLCDGSSLLRASYVSLFNAIGTAFGTADGTHFNIPDARGIFLRGVGVNGTLLDAGGTGFTGVLGTYQNDKMQGHKFAPLNGSSFVHYNAGGQSWTMGAGAYFERSATTGNPITDGVNGAPRTGSETNPANLGVNYIIKY